MICWGFNHPKLVVQDFAGPSTASLALIVSLIVAIQMDCWRSFICRCAWILVLLAFLLLLHVGIDLSKVRLQDPSHEPKESMKLQLPILLERVQTGV